MRLRLDTVCYDYDPKAELYKSESYKIRISGDLYELISMPYGRDKEPSKFYCFPDSNVNNLVHKALIRYPIGDLYGRYIRTVEAVEFETREKQIYYEFKLVHKYRKSREHGQKLYRTFTHAAHFMSENDYILRHLV